MTRRLVVFRKRPVADFLLLFEAAFYLSMTRILTIVLPIKMVLKVCGLNTVSKGNIVATAPKKAQDISVAVNIGRAISRAARHVPFRAVCLQQALACAIMLRIRRVPVAVCFGIARSVSGSLEAHAWSKSGNAILTGAHGMERFTVLATISP